MLGYIARVGSIQFDPVDVAGISPEITLAARVRGFRREHLDRWLYRNRLLCDVWDKCACISRSDDYGALLEGKSADWGWYPRARADELTDDVYARLDALLDANEFVSGETLEGDRLLKGALLKRMAQGDVGVHHRKGRERYFSRIERLLSPTQRAMPQHSPEETAAYYVLRRIGSVGFLWDMRSDAYLGVHPHTVTSAARSEAYARLESQGLLARAQIDGIKQPIFYRPRDEAMFSVPDCAARAAFIAPLDNLIWDRKLIERIFDFTYTWEVYVPKEKRRFGSYTLPVLYGDRFVARAQLARRDGRLTIEGWWWEQDVRKTKAMVKAIETAFTAHAAMLGVVADEDALQGV